MFQETLLESSARPGRRKRWPIATAFLLETGMAATLVIVPLVSTGVLPVFAHVPIIAPLRSMRVTNTAAQGGSRGQGNSSRSRTEVVMIHTCAVCLSLRDSVKTAATGPDVAPEISNSDVAGPFGPSLIGNTEPPRPKAVDRIRLSTLSEAQLVKRVDPLYPQIAKVAGISGLVKLHAIIAKDGSIQSLSVISGHPLLARAAMEAVEQWQYRPYRLNGEAVEVETFITVNFKRER